MQEREPSAKDAMESTHAAQSHETSVQFARKSPPRQGRNGWFAAAVIAMAAAAAQARERGGEGGRQTDRQADKWSRNPTANKQSSTPALSRLSDFSAMYLSFSSEFVVSNPIFIRFCRMLVLAAWLRVWGLSIEKQASGLLSARSLNLIARNAHRGYIVQTSRWGCKFAFLFKGATSDFRRVITLKPKSKP